MTVAVLLGTTYAAHAEPAALFCNAVLRLADRPAGDSATASDALRGLLSAFEACAVPIALDSLGAWLVANRDSRVATTRAGSEPLDTAVPRLLAKSSADAPCLVHLVCGENAVTFSAVRKAFEAVSAHDPDLSAMIAGELARDDLLVTAVIPVLRRPLGTAARRLWTLAADRAAERLPTGARSSAYEQRLRHDLQSFWGARDDNAEMLLWLAEQMDQLRINGHAVGPALRNAGGSLVAYCSDSPPSIPSSGSCPSRSSSTVATWCSSRRWSPHEPSPSTSSRGFRSARTARYSRSPSSPIPDSRTSGVSTSGRA